MYYKTNYESPIGTFILASNETSLVGLWMVGQKYFLNTLDEEPIWNARLEIFNNTKTWLDKYFNFENPKINELPLAPIGGEFRQHVWRILCDIPYGEVLTYGEIAKRIAEETNRKTMSAQAVGNAVGHNPISIIIPCHRVVGRNGSLTGYAGGLDNKIKLLRIEGIDTNNYFKPKKGTAL